MSLLWTKFASIVQKVNLVCLIRHFFISDIYFAFYNLKLPIAIYECLGSNFMLTLWFKIYLSEESEEKMHSWKVLSPLI